MQFCFLLAIASCVPANILSATAVGGSALPEQQEASVWHSTSSVHPVFACPTVGPGSQQPWGCPGVWAGQGQAAAACPTTPGSSRAAGGRRGQPQPRALGASLGTGPGCTVGLQLGLAPWGPWPGRAGRWEAETGPAAAWLGQGRPAPGCGRGGGHLR